MSASTKRWAKASGLVAAAGETAPPPPTGIFASGLPPLPGQANAPESPAMVLLDKIDRSPYQNRVSPAPEAVAALAADLKANGLNSPVVVRPKADGRYELVVGETRTAAFRLNGEVAIPAFVRTMADGEAARRLVADNFFHAEMSDYEIYQGLVTAKAALEADGLPSGLSDLAALTPWGKSQIHRLMSFGRLPPEALAALAGAASVGPPALRARAAADLAALAESGCPPEVIAQAVREALSGACEPAKAAERAKAIMAGAATPRPNKPAPPSLRAVSAPDGRLAYTLQRMPKGVMIKGVKGEDWDTLIADLLAWLEARMGAGAGNGQ